jgi:hypothetical protein
VAGIQLTVRRRWAVHYRSGSSTLAQPLVVPAPPGFAQAIGAPYPRAYAAATFYTTNTDYFGKVLSQDRLGTHAISPSAAPASGWRVLRLRPRRRITIDDVTQDSTEFPRLLSFGTRRPPARRSSFISGITPGWANYDTFQLAWQYAFGGKP